MTSAFVRAGLTFIGKVDGTPTNYFDVEPPPGVPHLYPRVEHEVEIHDARPAAPGLSLDREGFVLVAHPAGAGPAELVREVSGAWKVVIFDQTHRSSALRQRTEGIDIAVNEVHNDYTARSGPRRVRELIEQLLPGENPTALLERRYAIFNLWRPTNGVVEQMPVALCDMATMKPTDFVDAELKWAHRTGFVSAVRHHPAQRWCYFPGLGPDQAIVFKTFDSEARGGSFGAHTAFEDPTTRPGARVRESIELRAIALYR